ncbi:hypothetical protein A4A49_38583, partial [Nicotiana attenuata]
MLKVKNQRTDSYNTTTDGLKVVLAGGDIPDGAQFFNKSGILKNVSTVLVERALARMSQTMAIEAGNRVLKDRGTGCDIVTATEGDRPTNATSEQTDNAAGYKAIGVYDEGREHVHAEALEWADVTTSKAVNMENSSGVMQANTGAWKPTVDRATMDPKTKSDGQSEVPTAQQSEVQGVENAKNVQQFAHDKEKISAMQEKRSTVASAAQINKQSGLKATGMHVEGQVLNTQRQFASTPSKLDTKNNNWTEVNKSPRKKQTPDLQNQIVPSNAIGVSNSFDALVNEGEHFTKEAESKEQQMDNDTRSIAEKMSSTGTVKQNINAKDIGATLDNHIGETTKIHDAATTTMHISNPELDKMVNNAQAAMLMNTTSKNRQPQAPGSSTQQKFSKNTSDRLIVSQDIVPVYAHKPE